MDALTDAAVHPGRKYRKPAVAVIDRPGGPEAPATPAQNEQVFTSLADFGQWAASG